ncbi:MAG: FkbM family methyltransferase [Bacteroidales bacterium]|nr:FkbM family methyltransferase [Bacteroidales bacterium]MCB8998737.1 FkbM family methyltransferase [Bacteroidales bacterium]
MRKIAWFFLRILHISDIVHLKIAGYLKDSGWFKSFYKRESVDKNNNPIPWCTYPFIDFIGPRLTKKMRVFEYGSGNSTIWFSERVEAIVSLEHDKLWHDKLRGRMPENAHLVYKELHEDGEYSNYINEIAEKYDLVIVDGRDRVNCAKKSVNALREGGVLVFDNSDVDKYSEAMKFLKEKKFKRLDFYGIGPITTIRSCTSIFYKENNCLGI